MGESIAAAFRDANLNILINMEITGAYGYMYAGDPRYDTMTETIVNRKELPEMMLKKFRTENVRVRETDGAFCIMPVEEERGQWSRLIGMFAGNPDLTVDKFMESKRAEKEMEL